MYRVELKDCSAKYQAHLEKIRFLMYRVELKVLRRFDIKLIAYPFLMYRVELKVRCCGRRKVSLASVPNVPCGVERFCIGENSLRWFLSS